MSSLLMPGRPGEPSVIAGVLIENEQRTYYQIWGSAGLDMYQTYRHESLSWGAVIHLSEWKDRAYVLLGEQDFPYREMLDWINARQASWHVESHEFSTLVFTFEDEATAVEFKLRFD